MIRKWRSNKGWQGINENLRRYMKLGERMTKLLRRNDPRLPGVLIDKFIKRL